MVSKIAIAVMRYKHEIRAQFEKIYSQDLINNLFSHTYTKIDLLQRDLSVSRPTATNYLDQLAAAGFLLKRKLGRSNYFINKALYEILTNTILSREPAEK